MPEELNFQYYYGNEAEQFSFIRIPKAFFTNKAFSNLTYGSKILYGILLDRMSLSIKNQWLDKDNKVFIYFTIDSIQEELNCSRPTAVSLLQELEQIGLVEKKRQPNKPTILYIKNFILVNERIEEKNAQNKGSKEIELPEVKEVNFRKLKNFTSGSKKDELPEVKNFNSNNTEYNNTEYLIPSSSTDALSEEEIEKLFSNCLNWKIVDEKIQRELKQNMNMILFELFYLTNLTDYNINGNRIPGESVRQKILEVFDTDNYLSVANAVISNPNPIKQLKPFIISCFYNLSVGMMRVNSVQNQNLSKNQFNNFKQHNYDFDKIEKALLQK